MSSSGAPLRVQQGAPQVMLASARMIPSRRSRWGCVFLVWSRDIDFKVLRICWRSNPKCEMWKCGGNVGTVMNGTEIVVASLGVLGWDC